MGSDSSKLTNAIENQINYMNSGQTLNSQKSNLNNKKFFTQDSRNLEKDAMENVVNVEFKWNLEGNQVYVTGTFTNWKNHIKLHKLGATFITIHKIEPGIHQYKFVVDGEWRFSPDDATIIDENGNINNIVDTAKFYKQSNNFFVNQSSGINAKNLNSQNVYIKKKSKSIIEKIKQQASDLFQEEDISKKQQFAESAQPIPDHLIKISFLKEKEQQNKFAWEKLQNNQIDDKLDKLDDFGVIRAFQCSTSIEQPSHIVLNHLGCRKSMIDKTYQVYVLTQRFRGKYTTYKFYTNKYMDLAKFQD